jgi:hypothetical protein
LPARRAASCQTGGGGRNIETPRTHHDKSLRRAPELTQHGDQNDTAPPGTTGPD